MILNDAEICFFTYFLATLRFLSAKLLRFGKKRNKFLCFALYFT